MDTHSPYFVTANFEAALCRYTGAPYAVAVNSCTAALQLCCEWHGTDAAWTVDPYDGEIEIPRRTYVSVPMAIKRAGAKVAWRDERWRGVYQLKPLPVWDCARRFTGSMYFDGQFQCVSFSTTKILGAEQGGAILHDNAEADKWFRRMRFDGRTEGVEPRDDVFDLVGLHCIMLPSTAAELILKLWHLPATNPDQPFYEYPDLSVHPAFK